MTIPNTKSTFIVLVLERAFDRTETSEILMGDGYRVIAAATAEQALAVIHARWETRLVVTDVDLPGPMDGYALARLLDVKWPGIGVVVIGTRDPRPKDLPSKARFLLKPNTRSSLIPLVHELLAEQSMDTCPPDPGRSTPRFPVQPYEIRGGRVRDPVSRPHIGSDSLS